MKFIEPGCGLAHISRWAAAAYSWKEVVAIDLRYSLLALARVCSLGERRRKVRLVRQDVLTYAVTKNSFMYCYLSVPILKEMHASGKFASCLVVCLTFAIPDVPITETIPVHGWQKRMLVYDFR